MWHDDCGCAGSMDIGSLASSLGVTTAVPPAVLNAASQSSSGRTPAGVAQVGVVNGTGRVPGDSSTAKPPAPASNPPDKSSRDFERRLEQRIEQDQQTPDQADLTGPERPTGPPRQERPTAKAGPEATTAQAATAQAPSSAKVTTTAGKNTHGPTGGLAETAARAQGIVANQGTGAKAVIGKHMADGGQADSTARGGTQNGPPDDSQSATVPWTAAGAKLVNVPGKSGKTVADGPATRQMAPVGTNRTRNTAIERPPGQAQSWGVEGVPQAAGRTGRSSRVSPAAPRDADETTPDLARATPTGETVLVRTPPDRADSGNADGLDRASPSPEGTEDKTVGHDHKGTASDSVFRDLRPTIVPAAGNAKKVISAKTLNEKADGAEPLETLKNPGAGAAARPSTVAGAPKPDPGSPGTPLKSAAQQVQESIAGSVRQGHRVVTVRLNPPELGKVTVKLQEQDNRVTGLLEVTKPETRAEIQQALPEMLRNLQQAGVQVRRLDVTLNDAPQRQAGGEGDSPGAEQHGGASEQGFAGPNHHSGYSGIDRHFSGSLDYVQYREGLPGWIADESIDVFA